MDSTDKLKLIFGFAILVILAGLAGIIALKNISAETSFGLESIVTALAALAGAFGNWAFGSRGGTPNGK